MTTLRPAGELLPHRPPFLFLDEVLECDETHVRAARTFRADEDFFRGHFPGRPIVPGVLLVEAMAQAFAYWGLTFQKASAVYLTGVDRARFRRPVNPGDRVELEVRVEGMRLGLVTGRAEATVGGTKVADARLTGRFEPA
jgi:3-hydroxyacyl-[acyl-carrier-protein] dehydratase